MGTELYLVLVLISFAAGVGITAIGPGGIFLTIALYALAILAPPEVAGTASATFVATGLLGTAAYVRSGELRTASYRRTALLLSVAGIAGALGGSLANPYLSERLFGILLGTAAVAVGGLIIHQTRRGLAPRWQLNVDTRRGKAFALLIGLGIGFAAGMLGLGGPVIAVPALVVLGVPILAAVAVAQVQSVFIAAFATVGFAVQGAVLWMPAVILGIPQLLGAVIGWRIAHRVPAARLKFILGVVLVITGAYLVY